MQTTPIAASASTVFPNQRSGGLGRTKISRATTIPAVPKTTPTPPTNPRTRTTSSRSTMPSPLEQTAQQEVLHARLEDAFYGKALVIGQEKRAGFRRRRTQTVRSADERRVEGDDVHE